MTDHTPADELRAAATKLRETYAALTSYVDVRGPIGLEHWAEWFGPDDVTNLPVVNAWIALASPALAEPLAAWLEKTADAYEFDHTDVPPGLCHCLEAGDPGADPVLVAALTSARAITGRAS